MTNESNNQLNPVTPKEIGQVENQLLTSQEKFYLLQEKVNQLENELLPILFNEPDKPESRENAPQPNLVPLAMSLHSNNQQLDEIISQVSALIERIEL